MQSWRRIQSLPRETDTLGLHFPAGGDTVVGEKKERWLELCEQASKEQDSGKLLSLIGEINRLLEEKEKSLWPSREAEPKAS